ncbi:MAG: pilus assembly protein [Ardenticatenaceae bacterium]|nr:pilus assembly protein [Ardenticatenaceae bacterium]
MLQQEKHSEEGQGLLEFALGFTVLILILTGIVDLGRAYFTYVALGNAAGEGAAYGSFRPRCRSSADNYDCGYPNNVVDRVRNESQNGLIQTDRIENVIVETPNPTVPQIGDPITVTVVYDHEFLMPFFRGAGVNSIRLQARAVQPIRAP